MRAARFTAEGDLAERAARPTLPEEGVDAIVGRLVGLIEQVYPADPAQLGAVGVAAPGPLDVETGVIRSPPNLPFDHTPLRDVLTRHLGVTVSLLNDADAAALAEHRRGAGRGMRNMVYLTVGTGVGGGLILNGELYHGRGQAGEAGYMSIATGSDTPYAEHLISGPAIARRTRERMAAGEESCLKGTITGEAVAQAAAEGDALAQAVIEEVGHYLGVLAASLMMLLHPDGVVIGGGVAALGGVLFEPMQAAIEETCIDPVYYAGTPVLPAALGADAGLVGAALYAQAPYS
jgi:glucokinase